MIKLKAHQQKAVDYLNRNNVNSLLLAFPTGSGKTITAIAYSKKFLKKFPNSKVIFIGPLSVLSDAFKTIELLEADVDKYELYSYQKFRNEFEQNRIYCTGNLLIIDEAHNLKSLNKGGERAKSIFKCASFSRKRLLLTATPFINELEDLSVLVNFLFGAPIIHKRSQVRVVEDLLKYIKGKVYYIPLTKNRGKDFPSIEHKEIKITMPADYQKDYCKLISGEVVNDMVFLKPYSFYNAHRRVVNKIGRNEQYFSIKMDKAMELAKGYKSVIFTNWLEFGIKPISKELKKNKIKFAVYQGSMSEAKRNRVVYDYNNDLIDVLVITASGKEAINLIGTRRLIIMDPVWNYSGMLQIEGRAARYKSHEHLPFNERKVEVFNLVLVTEKGAQSKKNKRKCISGDEVVYKFIEQKRKMQFSVHKLLKEASI